MMIALTLTFTAALSPALASHTEKPKTYPPGKAYAKAYNNHPDKTKGLRAPGKSIPRHRKILWFRLHPAAYQHMRQISRVGGVYSSPNERGWRKVQSCECNQGSGWDCRTGNGYYGGLQMDKTFYTTYGPEFVKEWGDPSYWPDWAQMKAADRAYANRGLVPWPNCGRARIGYRFPGYLTTGG